MFVTGQAQFLESRHLKDKNITFAVFGFQQDFDRREFLVQEEMVDQLPRKANQNCQITMQILKRYDGKEDLRLLECKAI